MKSFTDRRQLLRQRLQFNLFARLQLFVAIAVHCWRTDWRSFLSSCASAQ